MQVNTVNTRYINSTRGTSSSFRKDVNILLLLVHTCVCVCVCVCAYVCVCALIIVSTDDIFCFINYNFLLLLLLFLFLIISVAIIFYFSTGDGPTELARFTCWGHFNLATPPLLLISFFWFLTDSPFTYFQFSLVQDGMRSMRSEKPVRTPPHLSEFSPMFSFFVRLTMAPLILSRKVI